MLMVTIVFGGRGIWRRTFGCRGAFQKMAQGLPEALERKTRERKGRVVIGEEPGLRCGFSAPAGSMRVRVRMSVRQPGMIGMRVSSCRRSFVRMRRPLAMMLHQTMQVRTEPDPSSQQKAEDEIAGKPLLQTLRHRFLGKITQQRSGWMQCYCGKRLARNAPS